VAAETPTGARLPLVVLISGGGSNLQALIDAEQAGELPVDIRAVISNRADAGGLARAERAGISARVLSHRETPGLGDKIDLKKSNWVLGFDGRSLTNPDPTGWAVKKDKGVFDQFTGATITPRAVVAATLRVLQYADANRQRLFGLSADEPAEGAQ